MMTDGSRRRVIVSRCTDTDEAAVFYRGEGYPCPVDPADTVLAARRAGALAGVVRLALEHGVLVLRGMQVDHRCQRQGIGSLLLAAAVEEIGGRECWCLPYGHLDGFYSSGGFRVAEQATVPGFLVERAKGYDEQGRSVIVMRRPPRGRI